MMCITTIHFSGCLRDIMIYMDLTQTTEQSLYNIKTPLNDWYCSGLHAFLGYVVRIVVELIRSMEESKIQNSRRQLASDSKHQKRSLKSEKTLTYCNKQQKRPKNREIRYHNQRRQLYGASKNCVKLYTK